jgi:signal transduction histidine kinase
MKCPRCQHENPESQKFCGECGTSLPRLDGSAHPAPSCADVQRSLSEALKQQDERLDQIRADERKIRQVVLNLLSNAIKFTPESGRIEVRAVPVDGAIEVSVSDTGVGIAPEDQEAIFEEFKQVGTAAKKVEGTGLGLALSRKFIELHGGRIWVKSQAGQGSTFTFTIPVRRGD